MEEREGCGTTVSGGRGGAGTAASGAAGMGGGVTKAGGFGMPNGMGGGREGVPVTVGSVWVAGRAGGRD